VKNPEVCSFCCARHGVKYLESYGFHLCCVSHRVVADKRYLTLVAEHFQSDDKIVNRLHNKGMIFSEFLPPYCVCWLGHMGGHLPKITARDRKRKQRISKIVCRSCISTLRAWHEWDERIWHKYKCVDCPKRMDIFFHKATERPPRECPYTMEMTLALQKL